jgi:nucleoside-diphosphate-sugar epimerase
VAGGGTAYRPSDPGALWADVPVLVTGGAGFIGSHLVAALAAAGARVRVLDDLSSGRRDNLEGVAAGCDLLVGDLRDEATCRRACAGVRVVFHQAAIASVPRSIEHPGETMAVNVAGTAGLFAAARDAGVERVVYASSSAVYGDAEARVAREGGEGSPRSPYALSKAMDEALAEHFWRHCGLPSVGLRYFNVYGPRQDPRGPYAAVIPRFLEALVAGRPATIFGDGLQTRDFVFVDDAVRANLLAALGAERTGRAYNVATGVPASLLELVARLTEVAPGWPPPTHQEPRAGELRHSQGDPTAALQAFGFRAEVPLAEGLAQTLAWYRCRPGAGERSSGPRRAGPTTSAASRTPK